MAGPVGDLVAALQAKDARLYGKLCLLAPWELVREWKKVYPEDFPQGGMSPATPASIMPRANPLSPKQKPGQIGDRGWN